MFALVLHSLLAIVVVFIQFFDCRAELREYRHPKCRLKNATIVYGWLTAELILIGLLSYVLLIYRSEMSFVEGLSATIIFWVFYGGFYATIASRVDTRLYNNYWRARKWGLVP